MGRTFSMFKDIETFPFENSHASSLLFKKNVHLISLKILKTFLFFDLFSGYGDCNLVVVAYSAGQTHLNTLHFVAQLS